MLDKSKTDPKLGKEISSVIKKMGVETPMFMIHLDDSKKRNIIESSFRNILKCLGLDIKDDSLVGTPKRMAKMYINELFWGLDYDNFPKITLCENKMNYSSMVLERDIKVVANCEHHLLPFIGKCYIAYIPGDYVIGLSKLNRVVEFFSRRPQVQERLTEQIYYALSYLLNTEDIAVLIKAEHSCVKVRGVEDNSNMVTSRLGGKFFTGELRNEFLSLIQK